jgi:hypothetical protein
VTRARGGPSPPVPSVRSARVDSSVSAGATKRLRVVAIVIVDTQSSGGSWGTVEPDACAPNVSVARVASSVITGATNVLRTDMAPPGDCRAASFNKVGVGHVGNEHASSLTAAKSFHCNDFRDLKTDTHVGNAPHSVELSPQKRRSAVMDGRFEVMPEMLS